MGCYGRFLEQQRRYYRFFGLYAVYGFAGSYCSLDFRVALFYKADYLKILMMPVNYIANYEIKKYEKEDKHVTFKNIAIAEKMTIEDVIQERIQKEKETEHIKEADQLRKNISEKIIKRREQ